MRFFARFTFICNVCFIIAVILRAVELSRKTTGNFSGAIKFQPLEATLVILGYGAIFVNFVFLLLLVYLGISRKLNSLPAWIWVFNLLIFPFQFYFFFK